MDAHSLHRGEDNALLVWDLSGGDLEGSPDVKTLPFSGSSPPTSPSLSPGLLLPMLAQSVRPSSNISTPATNVYKLAVSLYEVLLVVCLKPGRGRFIVCCIRVSMNITSCVLTRCTPSSTTRVTV